MLSRLAFKSLATAFALASLASSAHAESLERGFDMDVFTRYQKQEKQQAEDGFVLENLRDQRGRTTGKFSLGGKGNEEDPFYNFGATQNIRAQREDEMGSGILNLRVSF